MDGSVLGDDQLGFLVDALRDTDREVAKAQARRAPESLWCWLNRFVARVEPDLADERIRRSVADRYVSVRPDLDGVSFLSACLPGDTDSGDTDSGDTAGGDTRAKTHAGFDTTMVDGQPIWTIPTGRRYPAPVDRLPAEDWPPDTG